ncbi:MAG: aspartate 1-decarboxylase [Desulfovibrio sp.]|nr:aspartate 1-decarboxylase [Desulfovibrio sp.]
MIKILRSKLHGIRVTSCDLNYHGSVTLDPEICAAAGIIPLEFVYIWNKNTGVRLSTYVLTGPKGSCCCVLNGAAARTCEPGDVLIITAFEYVNTQEEILQHTPKVLMFDSQNQITSTLSYIVELEDGLPMVRIRK